MSGISTKFLKCATAQKLTSRSLRSKISETFVELSKTNEVLQAEFVNYNMDSIYFTAYNTFGFQLSDGTKILGPCAVFPKNAFAWNVGDVSDINEKSLSLFFNLTPKIDILVIGQGLNSQPPEYRRIEKICSEFNIGVEILPTPNAIGCFNILSSEGRYVAGAMIPPPIIERNQEHVESIKRISVNDKSGISLLTSKDQKESAVLSLPLTWSERRRIAEQKKFLENISSAVLSRRLFRLKRFVSHNTKLSIEKENVKEQNEFFSDYVAEKKRRLSPPKHDETQNLSQSPLLNEIFLGRVPLEIFNFPQLPERQDYFQLEDMYNETKDFILRKENLENVIDIREDLSKIGLYGLQIPLRYGGLGLNHIQSSRVWESIGIHQSITNHLIYHCNYVARAIEKFGVDAQKDQYLPKLSNGSIIGSFCLAEDSCGSDVGSVDCLATPSENGKILLNGTKRFITNGKHSDLFLVQAKLPSTQHSEEEKICLFLISKESHDFNKILISPRLNVASHSACEINDIKFDNLEVGQEDILSSELGNGFKQSQYLTNSNGLVVASSLLGLLRYLYSYTLEHVISRYQFGKALCEFPIVQVSLADMASDIYALESGVYLISGLLDESTVDRDLTAEMAALKVFSVETATQWITSLIELFGAIGFHKQLELDQTLLNILALKTMHMPNKLLLNNIGLSGLMYQGINSDFANKRLNKFRSFRSIARYIFERDSFKFGKRYPVVVRTDAESSRNQNNDESFLLADHLHFNLRPLADNISSRVMKFSHLTEKINRSLLGALELEQEPNLICGQISIDMLMNFCVLSRLNRALSIGLPKVSEEKQLTELFTLRCFNNIDRSFEKANGYMNESHRKISAAMIRERGYSITHPTSRVW